MNLKSKLNYLVFSIALIFCLNRAIYAQGETYPISPNASFTNINHENQKNLTAKSTLGHSFPLFLSFSFSHDTLSTAIKGNLKTKEFYLQRSKNQRTTAWILLGGGTGLLIGGIILTIGDVMAIVLSLGTAGSGKLIDVAGDIASVGLIADLVSIPFFISASHNKKMAATLSFDNQSIYSSPNNSFSSHVHPSLTLKIRF